MMRLWPDSSIGGTVSNGLSTGMISGLRTILFKESCPSHIIESTKVGVMPSVDLIIDGILRMIISFDRNRLLPHIYIF